MISREPKDLNFKFLLHLAFAHITIYLAADSVAFRMVSFFGTLEPAPPFIFPISYAIADVIAEVYGYRVAKKVLWLTLAFQLFYALIIQFALSLPTPPAWQTQSSYRHVFGGLFQFISAGTAAVLASSFVNIYVISRLKIIMNGKHFWLRSISSSAIGGIVLVGIIVVIGYQKTVSGGEAFRMFVTIYLIELFYAFITAWPAWLLSGYLKLKENIDVYDFDTSFNPFSIR